MEQHYERTTYVDSVNDKLVHVDVINDDTTFAWRLVIGDGEPGFFNSEYKHVYVHQGYGLATEYYCGKLPAMVPFKITPLDLVE